jgi:hypothetical protein
MATTRPFAYNPTSATITGTINIGTLCIGVSALDYSSNPGGLTWWMGPDEDTGYVIAKDVSSSDFPTPLGNIGNVQFWRTSSISNSEFIELAQILTSQIFLDSDSAKTYLNSNGYWTSFELSLLLDLYPNAAVAYSLRKLRGDYAGSSIRVRKSSDNSEYDIGFVDNELDINLLTSIIPTNMFTFSEDITNATAWLKSNLNITGIPAYSNTILAPDGSLTADKIIENTANSTHLLSKSGVNATFNSDFNISVYLKAGERTKVNVISNIFDFNNPRTCTVDLTNGTISNNNHYSTPIVTSVGDGWYRFSVYIKSSVNTSSIPIRIQLLNELDQGTYLGDNTSGCYVWGFQMTLGASLKDYERTTSDVTRSIFIKTWYDQSVNGRDAIQLTPTNQAQIIQNGSFIMIGSKITTIWTVDSYTISPFTTTKPFVSTFVIKRNGIGNNGQFGSFVNSGSTTAAVLRWLGATSNDINTYLNTARTHSINNQTLGYFLLTTYKTAADFVNVRNNSVELSGGISTVNGTINSFGNANGSATIGNVNEAILWHEDYTSLISGIETKINEYYAIY